MLRMGSTLPTRLLCEYHAAIFPPTADHASRIFYSGLNFDTDLGNVTAGLPLNDQGDVFDIESFPYADKIVFELHNYNNALSDSNCANFNMYSQGWY